ncbi:MAG: hypothetical protein PWQ82_781 [Thermosediminibacterales bacterium]|nr:hypothetical protein [Thermosediminibacterales bacterium]MDK2835646.1 hypothetical protein [Thermosediminibacterales bacterium]
MDITLESIDAVRERTGVSYRRAKEALEKTNGNVVDALILLEESEKRWTEEISVKGNELVSKIKEIIHKGNVTNIKIKKGDKVLAEIPVTAGAVGALLVPQLAGIGILAALLTRCNLEIERKGNNDTIGDQNSEKKEDIQGE